MLITPFEELSESMRRYYCEAAQRVLKRRRVVAKGSRWLFPSILKGYTEFSEPIEPQWSQTQQHKSPSRTSELHCTIDLSKLPRGTREVVVTIEGVP